MKEMRGAVAVAVNFDFDVIAAVDKPPPGVDDVAVYFISGLQVTVSNLWP